MGKVVKTGGRFAHLVGDLEERWRARGQCFPGARLLERVCPLIVPVKVPKIKRKGTKGKRNMISQCRQNAFSEPRVYYQTTIALPRQGRDIHTNSTQTRKKWHSKKNGRQRTSRRRALPRWAPVLPSPQAPP